MDPGESAELDLKNLAIKRHPVIQYGQYVNGTDVHRHALSKLWWGRTTALHDACDSGYLSLVRQLLRSGSHLDSKDRDGRTPLMCAVHRGHDEVVLELLRAGASVTAKNERQQTALYYASSPRVVQSLIAAGSNVNEQDWNNATPLMLATEGHHNHAVHELIRAGAIVTAKDMWQRTALHYASKGDHPDVIKPLVEAGASINEQDEDGWTPLMDASERGHGQVVHELITAGANVSAKNRMQRTALHYASRGNHVNIAQALIKAGAFIDEQDEGGRTPLMDAAEKGHDQVGHKLITAGASVTVKNKQQQTSLHLACKGGYSSVVRTIAEAGANVNEKDEGGRTPLMGAAKRGNEQVVLELIRAGASVTAISSHPTTHMEDWSVAADSTALHFAATCNNLKPECGVLLMEAGADMTTRNRDTKSALDLASSQFRQAIQQVPPISTKRIVAVIGNTKHGKSTLVASLQAEGNNQWKKFTTRFINVWKIRQQTTGIETVHFSSQSCGDTLFYDFAGQSNFPHQTFLEALLSKSGVNVTLLLLVKATEAEDIIKQDITHWLRLLALMSVPATPQVILVGSFLDQVRSRRETTEKLRRCTHSVQQEFPFSVQGPCLLNCRKPDSEGIRQIRTFIQGIQPLQLNCSTLSYNLHWVLVQMRKAFPGIPAITFHTFQSWLLDDAKLLPRSVTPLEKVCHDLTVTGHALFLPSKQDSCQSWLILDFQAILHNMYGTLFSRTQAQANRFGLLRCSQLAELFPKLDPAMIQELLISLDFCIHVNPLIIRDEQLRQTATDRRESWLYFPALVSAQPPEFLPELTDPQLVQWMCWQLRTTKKHFISARVAQIVILHLAANRVFTHKLSPSVRERSCSVWVNGLSWTSIEDVDIVVQIIDSSVVQVVGYSTAGSEKLHQYVSTIVRSIIKTITQVSPKLEALSYIVHPFTPAMLKDPKVPPAPDSLFPISSIISCISGHCDQIQSLQGETGCLSQQMSVTELFGGWSPAISAVVDMEFKGELQSGECTCVSCVVVGGIPNVNGLVRTAVMLLILTGNKSKPGLFKH